MFATVVVTGVALAAAPGTTQAQQNFPSKPIRLVASTTAEEYNEILRVQIQTLFKLVLDAGLRPK